jgi:hypothetical protein
MHVVKPYHELMAEAKEAESFNDHELAIRLYEQALKQESHLQLPYDRLMVLYRRQKDLESELNVIHKGLRAFEEFYRKRAEKVIGKQGKAARLSAELARSLGQKGQKGSNYHMPEPIPKWTHRKKLVEKKLGKH